jgi:rod shape determining protein RodA
MPFLIRLKKFDWVLVISAILLAVFGLLSIYSSSLGRGNFSNFEKQATFLGVGFFLMFLISFFDLRALRDSPYLILILYFICVLALIGLFFVPEIRGVKSWYKLGPVSIDPIEFTKIILIVLLAKYFSMRHVEMYRLRHIILSGVYVIIPGLLIFFQPDLGSVLVLISLWIAILIISGIKIKHFLILCLVIILVSILAWSFLLKDYQKQRILDYANPQFEPLGVSWSRQQARIAVGSGGIFGQGLGKGSQTQYGFLPEPQTDFIFSSLAEETGMLGILLLLFLYCVFIWRIIKIALFSKSNFFRLFSSGLTALLISQFFIHTGMNLGLLPIIGIPLPLVSYGGSSLVTIFISLGVIQGIKVKS